MNVRRMVAVHCLVWLTLNGLSLPTAQAGSAGMIARTWDQEMTLPPGGYRAGKPIQMDGSFKVHISPGTYIDGVDFMGKEHDQKFKIDGAVLRKTKLVGQLGFSVDARDSVFDECTLHRTGGWFVDMWGSHWKFENCVINKDFLLPEIDVGNYAIHAVNTTFIGVKMPAIKYKNDPSKYLQKGDLVFQKCRFVQCDIPESVLAACVDCVFDGCQFPAKKSDWSTASEAIKVSATIVGTGHFPASYMNGKLAVQFTQGAASAEGGSTLPFTAIAGHVTVSTVKIPQQFTMLGTTEKRASEIADFSATPAPAIGATPAPGPASAAAPDVRSLDDFLKAIPANADLVTNGTLNPIGVETANTQIQQALNGKTVTLRPVIDFVGPTQEEGHAYKASAREVAMTYRGLTIPLNLAFLFHPTDAAPLAKAKGTSVVLHGKIAKAELQSRGRGLVMAVTITDSQF